MFLTLTLIIFSCNLFYIQGDNDVGTVLFSKSDLEKRCWSAEEMKLLNSRRIFQQILPGKSSIGFKDDDTVDDLVLYFQMILRTVRNKTKGSSKSSRIIMMKAMADMLGGFLYTSVLPLARSAFYAGVIKFESIQKLNHIFEEIKIFLKTNGEGWKNPDTQAECTGAEVLPLKPPHGKLDPCECLIYQKQERGHNEACYEIPMPILDSLAEPSAIAVPFKTYSLRKLESSSSAYILVKYYVATMRCYMSINAESCCITRFHKRFQHWLNTHVSPHIQDSKTYAAFGGIYRVMETMKNIDNGAVERSKNVSTHNGSCTYGNKNKSKNNIILVALLATIFVWFLIGSIVICLRLNSAKGGETYNVEIGTSSSCKTSSSYVKRCKRTTQSKPTYTSQFSTQTSSRSTYSSATRRSRSRGAYRQPYRKTYTSGVCYRQQQTQSPSIMSSCKNRSRSTTPKRQHAGYSKEITGNREQNISGSKKYSAYQDVFRTSVAMVQTKCCGKKNDLDDYLGDTEDVTNEIEDFDYTLDECEDEEEQQEEEEGDEEEEDEEEEETTTSKGTPENYRTNLNDDSSTAQTSATSFRFLSEDNIISQKNNKGSSFF